MPPSTSPRIESFAWGGGHMPRKPQRSTSGRDAQGRSDARGQKLAGTIAVVAGATRGAGRGIARALAEAGAKVYCTGRSLRGNPSPYNRPETIEETAEMISAAGGSAVALRVDHTVEAEPDRFRTGDGRSGCP